MSNAVAAVAAAPSEQEWAAFAAIDWADQKNFWRLLPAGSRQSEAGELDSTPEAVEVWAVQQRFGGQPIAVILEQTRGPLVYMLTKYPHLVLFLVHPTTAARYRETFAPSGAKSDPSDTDSLLDLLLRHRERLRPLRPDTVETRLLHFLVEERRQTVDDVSGRDAGRFTDLFVLAGSSALLNVLGHRCGPSGADGPEKSGLAIGRTGVLVRVCKGESATPWPTSANLRLSYKLWTGSTTASRSFQPATWTPTRPKLPA
jgi:hypothetical protein